MRELHVCCIDHRQGEDPVPADDHVVGSVLGGKRATKKARSVAGLKEGTITVDVVNELVEARGDGRLEVE